MLFSSLALLSAATAVQALNPITVNGNAFYDSKTNDRFYIRGVDYLPGGSSNFSDPLADPEVCKRDIPYFQDLGLNTIRVYSIDNSADHDECMAALDEAGIYLILDVNTPKNSINRANPANSYNTAYLQHVFATIDAFKDYENTLGFFAANEVINNENTTNGAPYVKAVIRDMKSYIKAQANRTIPVGYSAADISGNRIQQAEYFNCGSDDERMDMMGINDYSWCGDSSFTQSGYSQKVQDYSSLTRPLFLSEFGCIKTVPRKFSEVGSIYSTDMTSVFSGGLVYEYSEEANGYGLVKINSDASITKKDDYDNLKDQLKSVTNPSGDGGANTSNDASTCPDYEDGVWEVDPNSSLPSMPSRASSFISSGAGKPLGTNGPDTSGGDAGDDPNNSSSGSADATATASSSSSSDASSSSSASSSATSSGAAAGAYAAIPTPFSAVVYGPVAVLVCSLFLGSVLVV